MLKRLWQILGPLVCGLLLAITIIAVYPVTIKHSLTSELADAVELTKYGFKSAYKKNRALSDPNQRFVPFFGSSEWLRFDKMHPSVLAETYNRNYRPYLLGQRGAASLTHYFGMQPLKEQLEGKQAIYVISPQWFVAKGANSGAFQNYFSNGQVIRFLQEQTGSPYDRYAAKRFLRMHPNSEMKELVMKVAAGKKLTAADKEHLVFQEQVFQKMDAFFSRFSLDNRYEKSVLSKEKTLPKEFSYPALEQIASKDGQKETSNNQLGIENSFYDLRIKRNLAYLKGSQKKFNYLKSPEYNDLQLVLEQFAKNQTNVLFIIPPVNDKWAAFTGLNLDMYQQSVAKIKYQLQSQGFTNIADFSRDGGKPYFMQDTIHMGWNGWLALDKAVQPFLSQPQTTPTYHLNENFLSKQWARYTGQPENFQP